MMDVVCGVGSRGMLSKQLGTKLSLWMYLRVITNSWERLIVEQILSASLSTQSGGRQHNEAVLNNNNDWVDGSSGDLAGGLKIGGRAGGHRFVEAKCL